MRSIAMICTTAAALTLTGAATMMPAQARHLGPGFVGGAIAGAAVAGAAASAYAYAPGPAYGYGEAYGYEPAPGTYGRREHPYRSYGVYDESEHGGQPSYTQP